MITLQSDSLTFAFPEIAAALRPLVEAHVRETLPRILADDRRAACKSLQHPRDHYVRDDTGARETAIRAIVSATPEQIEAALRKACLRAANLGEHASPLAVEIAFQRTLRIPDDGKTYPLPAGLGNFPLRHVDDFADSVPASWVTRGGVMMPMHQSEALWIRFHGSGGYPFAVKVGAGKINAVTGEAWTAGLQREPQNYLVLPEQPWLDGFAVSKGVIRQFVAMPLGGGYSVEEQITGRAETGGIQLQVFPLKAEAHFRRSIVRRLPRSIENILEFLVEDWFRVSSVREEMFGRLYAKPDAGDLMRLGAGGTMRQEIYADPIDFADWDTTLTRRCFVHLCNSLVWRQITGTNPPHPPLTAKEYARAGVPWFDYYRDDLPALDGSKTLASVKSVAQVAAEKGTAPLPGNDSIKPAQIIQYGNTRRPDEVREWSEA